MYATEVSPQMETLLNNYQIQQILPHRYPIQLVDQVIHFEEEKEIIATKAVGVGEPALRGHFPGFPIMPGVLLVEALGQTCALLLELTRRKWQKGDAIEAGSDQELGVLGGIRVKMLKPVLPGTLVCLKAQLDWSKGRASSLYVTAYDALNEKKVFVKGSILVGMTPKSSLVG